MTLPELEEKLLPLVKGVKDFQLNQETFIPDLEYTVNSYLSYLKAQSGKKGYMPYWNHLMAIYHQLSF